MKVRAWIPTKPSTLMLIWPEAIYCLQPDTYFDVQDETNYVRDGLYLSRLYSRDVSTE